MNEYRPSAIEAPCERVRQRKDCVPVLKIADEITGKWDL